MLTVLRIGQYRFHFYSDERGEPTDIHVATANGECKFWLEPIVLAGRRRGSPRDVPAGIALTLTGYVVTLSHANDRGEYGMPNLTMTIEGDVLKKTRKLAVEKNTSVTALVRTFLNRLAVKEEQSSEAVIAELQKYFHAPGVVIGPRTWRREDLHER